MDKISAEVERFKKGFPWLDIVAPATDKKGIRILSEAELDNASAYADSAAVDGKCKFVPASGAASRMFKDIFAGMEKPNDAVEKLSDNIERFAFYDGGVFARGGAVAESLLTDKGLGYGTKPKGVLLFHRYPDGECRTAFAEHLVEGQKYMCNQDGTVSMTVTVSPEHKQLFEDALASVKDKYESKYGVRYNVDFVFQDKATDTVAVDMENRPFLKDDGTPLLRPAGHGALIHNLNSLDCEMVSIKNIDNVAVESYLDLTARYKRALMGECLMLRDTIFSFLRRMDEEEAGGVVGDALLDEIASFLRDTLCVEIPDRCKRAEVLRAKLDRPIRVCGMVRNQGEPGGGPFIIRDKDGFTSLQILEGVQIDPNDSHSQACLKAATHFNPVDIVCCLKDYRGSRFDLLRYVDEETGFISCKSYQGRELKALELPGLWNGAMSDWNTLFVQVPLETFNPVKTVLDLLRPAHQNCL